MTERPAVFTHGPRFFQDGDATMFEFVIDAGNVIGPRLAHKNDIDKHPDAWKAFNDEMAAAEAQTETAETKAEDDEPPEVKHHKQAQKPAPKAGRGWRK